jgi:RNA polymerase sigma factor (TIGR02999 family)
MPTDPDTTGPAGDDAHDAHDVTRLLDAVAAGSEGAADDLARRVYDELHILATAAMRREPDGHTWQPTELVHETFVRLVGTQRTPFRNRHHFFGIAAQAIRRLLVDHARARRQLKRDGGVQVELTDGHPASSEGVVDMLALNDALDRLALLDARQARIVELRYFGGFSIDETATALDISSATVRRDWAVARAFLRRALSTD